MSAYVLRAGASAWSSAAVGGFAGASLACAGASPLQAVAASAKSSTEVRKIGTASLVIAAESFAQVNFARRSRGGAVRRVKFLCHLSHETRAYVLVLLL